MEISIYKQVGQRVIHEVGRHHGTIHGSCAAVAAVVAAVECAETSLGVEKAYQLLQSFADEMALKIIAERRVKNL